MSRRNRNRSRPPVSPIVTHPLANPSADQISITGSAHQETFSGPLPHPEHLRRFNEIVPGSAERIIRMAELQIAHRHELEKQVVEANIRYAEVDRNIQKRGQWFALILGIGILVTAGYCAAHGQAVPAAVIGGGGFAGFITAFMLGRSDAKAKKDMPEPATPKPQS